MNALEEWSTLGMQRPKLYVHMENSSKQGELWSDWEYHDETSLHFDLDGAQYVLDNDGDVSIIVEEAKEDCFY